MADREGPRDRIDRLLDPDSIAIAGASADPNKRGYTALKRLIESDYAGSVYPVNPGHEGEILGEPVFASVTDVPSTVDLVYVVTPAPAVATVLNEAGAAGAAGAVIFSAGFGEVGNHDAECELVRIAEEHGLRFLGPNVMGLVNAPADCYLGIDATYTPGEFGVISQSGNLGMSLGMQASREYASGISVLVSIGNEADLQFGDLLPYFDADEATGGLLLYAEGMADGRAFLREAAAFTTTKPIVALKGGRTEPGRSSARSHTASLAGDPAVIEDVYAQAGVTTVDAFDEVLPVAQALMGQPTLSGRNVAVMTEAGGLATIAADAIVEAGLAVPELSEGTQSTLRALFASSPNVSNPVDTMVTLETAALHGEAVEAIISDPTIDGLLICGEYGGYGLHTPDTPDLPSDEDTAEAQRNSAAHIARLPDEYGKPIIISSSYSPSQSPALATCRDHGIPVYGTLRYAPVAFRALAEYGTYLETADRRTDFAIDAAATPDERLGATVDESAGPLTERDARRLLAGYGVPLVPAKFATSPDEAMAAAEGYDGAVAMKIVSPDIQHKTEADGVSLGVDGGDAVREAYQRLLSNAVAYRPDASIEGVLVSPMRDAGVEVIVGGVHDEEVGPVVMFGLGGVFVEVLEDVAFAAVPLTEYDARHLLGRIEGAAVLQGARGDPGVDEEALVDLLLTVSDVLAENPGIAELDLNPVFCYSDGVEVIDAGVHR